MNTIKNGILFVILTLLWSCGSEKTEKEALPENAFTTVNIKTAPVESYSNAGEIKAIGILVSENETTASSKTGGIVRKTFVREGNFVKKGQKLATFDLTEIDAQIYQAKQAVEKAERDVRRVTNLHSDSVATLEHVENAKTALEVALKTLEIGQFNQQNADAIAPISGRIVKQMHYEGEMVGPGMPIFAILGTTGADWKVKCGLIDREWARVKVGSQASIVFDAFPDKTFQATVSDKSSIGGSASGTLDLDLKLKEVPNSVAAGMVGRVNILTSSSDSTLIIPIEALVNPNGKSAYVFVVEGQKASRKKITIGKIAGEKVTIQSGLNLGENVVTTGALYLEDGDIINAVNLAK